MRSDVARYSLLAAAMLAEPYVHAGMTVMQVEAPATFTLNAQQTDYATYAQFSPVTFPAGSAFGATVVPSSGGFSGLTFRLGDAYSATGSTPQATPSTSGHAITVGTNFYSSGKAGNPVGTNANEITDVWVNSSISFTRNVVKTQGTLGTNQPLPNYLYGGTTAPTATQAVRVVNNSYIMDYGSGAADDNAIRRLDFMMAREDAVAVYGAVSGVNGNPNYFDLGWTAWNGLSVRGTDSSQYFNPTASTVQGKRRADLWGTGAASYLAGTTSGYAGGLIYQSASLGAGYADGGKAEVVRSLMLTAGDRSTSFVHNSTSYTWARETQNNLSVQMGAGQVDYSESLSILQAGEKNVAAVANITPGSGITAPTIYSDARGWSFANVARNAEQVMLFSVPVGQTLTDLVASLTWDVSQATAAGGSALDTRDGARIFANLNLSLWSVAGGPGNYSLGSAFGYAGLSSSSTGDNVESLYWLAGGSEAIGAGTYAFLISDVSGTSVSSTDYGFSYSLGFMAVPEPGAVGLLMSGMLLLRRRTRAAA